MKKTEQVVDIYDTQLLIDSEHLYNKVFDIAEAANKEGLAGKRLLGIASQRNSDRSGIEVCLRFAATGNQFSTAWNVLWRDGWLPGMLLGLCVIAVIIAAWWAMGGCS